jgi:anti-sigma B factor antagonist
MSLHEHAHQQPRRGDQPRRLSEIRAIADGARGDRPEPFGIEITPARNRVIVTPHGELDIATTDEVSEAIDGLVAAGFAEIVLDLRRVSFMDSTGLRLVLRETHRADSEVRVIDGAAPVARLFDLTGVRAHVPFLAPHEVLRVRHP